MEENAGVDGAGDFSHGAENDAHGEDVDADVPLAVEEAEEDGDEENGEDK